MADEQIQKITLKLADLPANQDTFYIRFRLITDNLNETSDWSPVYEIQKTTA
jgi:hypothetical protein